MFVLLLCALHTPSNVLLVTYVMMFHAKPSLSYSSSSGYEVVTCGTEIAREYCFTWVIDSVLSDRCTHEACALLLSKLTRNSCNNN